MTSCPIEKKEVKVGEQEKLVSSFSIETKIENNAQKKDPDGLARVFRKNY